MAGGADTAPAAADLWRSALGVGNESDGVDAMTVTGDGASEIAAFDVGARDGDGVVTVLVRGEIDLVTAPRLEAAFAAALAEAETGVVFDLAGVTYFGSEGIRALVAACGRATALELRRTVIVSRIVQRILELAGLEEIVGT